jgi:SAM-dependent methyltransferase
VIAGLDTSKPNIARVYDYWLDGKDNFAADRKMAEHIAAIFPGVREMCRDNRSFVCRAATWAASRGIAQFLDLGSGLPTAQNTHEAARSILPDARVAYVDHDPVVVLHGKALLAKDPGVAVTQADLTDPAAIWASPGVRAMIDPDQPVCVILACVLHFLDAGLAREVAAGYAGLLAPGSVMIISAVHNDDPQMDTEARAAYTAGDLRNHSRADIQSFFGALEMVPPGLALAHAWRGGMADVPQVPKSAAYILGGVARKP